MRKILPGLYQSQRDNTDRPGSSCNVTSAVMALDASGHPTTEITDLPAGKRPEDYMTELGDSPTGVDAMRGLCPWFFDARGMATIPPMEAPLMLDWVVQEVYGRALIKYETVQLSSLINGIDNGRAAILRTIFTPEGHIIALVGYEAVDDVGGQLGQVTGLIIRDPWGDVNSGYANHNGDGVLIPLSIFMSKVRAPDQASKECHLVVSI
jgi:hypothetical protein